MTLMPIIPSSEATAYRLDNVTADGVTLELTSGTSLSSTNGHRWKPDGTRIFCVENDDLSGSYVYYWTCSTAWDLSTASYTARFALNQADGTTIEGGQPYDSLDFNDDGTEVTVIQGSTLRTWSLTEAYGGTTARIATEAVNGTSISFSTQGFRLHYLRSGQIYSRSIGTAYDISSMSTEVAETDLGTASSIDPARVGTRLVTVEGNVVKEYGTPTQNAFSSLTLNESFDPSASVSFASYADNGRKLYLQHNNVVTQYSTVQ